MALTAAAVFFVAGACLVLVPNAELGPPMLVRTAIATSCGLGAAMILGAVIVHRVAGGFVPLLTAVRVPVAIAIVVAIGFKMPWLGKPAVLVQAAGIALLYVVLLVLLREIGKDDLAVLKRALSRGKKK